MKKHKTKHIDKSFFFLLILSLFLSCKDDNNTTTPDITSINDSSDLQLPKTIKIINKVFSLPSPIQASMLVKEQNIPFNVELLNPPENYINYLTTYKKALNLGIYGANLANLFIYDQLSQSANYFNAIKKLTEQIGISNSLEEKTISKFENNINNKDSLISLLSDTYNQIDLYLLENEQEDIGVLILIGGWIESLYLLTKIIDTHDIPEIINRIGEQKNPIDNLIALLKPYYKQGKPNYNHLLEQLIDLNTIFKNVETTYTYEETDTDPDNKTTHIHSTTTYNITSQHISQISKKINKLRNEITN